MPKYEKTLGTSLSVSAEFTTDDTSSAIKWVAIDTSVKDINSIDRRVLYALMFLVT
ncbi:hypothetical protein BDD26_1952 [Xenorhabdus cabanillasii]|uniref:Uncharacterized protein n=1 Tax=Xenorhabdus cabanillasii TaxID=351673 RepID=A0A3D9UKT6_9GAMM|nr:hypothetical protein BDD26_1952 [Xenorhabdus cabanillasii]